MKINEIVNDSKVPLVFYHGSTKFLPVGTILVPSSDYELNWGRTGFYWILEKYRPSEMLAHKNSVFMVDKIDDIDLAGGGTDYIFTVEPIGKVERHDMNWSSEIDCLISDGFSVDSPEIIKAAKNYWNGIVHYNEQVWEYLTPSAKIVAVEDY